MEESAARLGLFDHCLAHRDRWRTLYLVAGMCDTAEQLAAACTEARAVFPDWPAAWETRDPTLYDIFTQLGSLEEPAHHHHRRHAARELAGYERWTAWGAPPAALVDWGRMELVAKALPLETRSYNQG